jgi:hypothetical protein
LPSALSSTKEMSGRMPRMCCTACSALAAAKPASMAARVASVASSFNKIRHTYIVRDKNRPSSPALCSLNKSRWTYKNRPIYTSYRLPGAIGWKGLPAAYV